MLTTKENRSLEDKERCAYRHFVRWDWERCKRLGSLAHDGKLWCRTHHPPTAQLKKQEAIKKWDAKYAAYSTLSKEKENDRKVGEYLRLSALSSDRERHANIIAALTLMKH